MADRLAVSTVTRDGELIAYGQPGVTDAERAAAGRETVANRDRELIEENRRRAVRRGDAADLPAGLNLARVWLPRDPAALRARLGASDLAVWADGDVLHVLWRGTATAVDTYGGIGARLWPVPGAADLWEASLRVRDLDRAALTVAVLPHTGGETPIGVPAAATLTWRGPCAPPAAATSEPAGTLVEQTITSPALGEARTVTVYRPPGDHGPLPGCVLADGEALRSFAEVLDPAIRDGRTPPVVVVGIHSGRGERRAREYLPGRGFAAHLRFVTDDVVPWAVRDLDVTPHRWIAAGFSNGGAWAVAAAQRRPDVFTGVAAFSAGVVPRRVTTAARQARVRHYLAAGSLEAGFRDATGGWAARLAAAGLDVRYDEWTGGHDHLWWRDLFPVAVAHLAVL